MTTVNPRWIIAKFQRGSFHAVWHRYTDMRTSYLIGKGSVDSVIDVNIWNSRIYCVFAVLHTTAVETVFVCANVWDDGYAQRPRGLQRHKWHTEQSPPSSCCRDHGPSSHPSEHTSKASLVMAVFHKGTRCFRSSASTRYVHSPIRPRRPLQTSPAVMGRPCSPVSPPWRWAAA